MLKKRIIPCLDIRNGQVTKGIQFQNNINLGDPVPLAKKYSDLGADEITIYDITASSDDRQPDFKTIHDIATQVFVPICVGGGIVNFEMAAQMIASGAEKISLNSIAPKKPELIKQIASVYGVQAVVLSVDVIRDPSAPSAFRIVTHGGRNVTDLDAIDWIIKGVSLGAGEVCINSINQDGKTNGFDLELLKSVRQHVSVPIIISGGAGTPQHIAEAFDAGADAAIVASMLHYGLWTIDAIKCEVGKLGHAMRR